METNTNIIAKKEYGEIVVADPFNPTEYHAAGNVSALVKSANQRVAERKAAFDTICPLENATAEECKALRLEMEKDDELLKNFGTKLSKALLTLSGFEAYVVQTKGAGARIDPLSARGKLAAMIKELKDREAKAKAASPFRLCGQPQVKTSKRMLVIDATDAAWKKIEDAIGKAGVVKGWMGELNTAKRIAAVKKIVDDIEAEDAAAKKAMEVL